MSSFHVYFRRLRKSRHGGILTLTALMLPVLIMLTALCVDLGMLFLAKTKADIAATTAVEAAEQRLPDIAAAQALGHQVALAMLDDAGFVSQYNVDVSATTSTVDVTVKLRVDTVLAKLVDINFLDTTSQAHRPLP